jgi:hypothetical protein
MNYYWTQKNFTVRPELIEGRILLRRTGLRRSRFDKLSANGFFVFQFKFFRVQL